MSRSTGHARQCRAVRTPERQLTLTSQGQPGPSHDPGKQACQSRPTHTQVDRIPCSHVVLRVSSSVSRRMSGKQTHGSCFKMRAHLIQIAKRPLKRIFKAAAPLFQRLYAVLCHCSASRAAASFQRHPTPPPHYTVPGDALLTSYTLALPFVYTHDLAGLFQSTIVSTFSGSILYKTTTSIIRSAAACHTIYNQ